MKKIFALLLVTVLCLGIFVSCGDDGDDSGTVQKDPFEQVSAMYEESDPSKIVATTSYGFSTHTLSGEYVLVIGEVDGNEAAVFTKTYQRLRDINSGSTINYMEHIETITETLEYIEGKGVRTNKKGSWNIDAEPVIPERGGIALNLDKSLATNASFENNKLVFDVAAAKTEELFGEGNGIDVPVHVEIDTDGEFVIGVSVSYVLPADGENNLSETTVEIKVVYTYDFESINIE